MAHVESTWESLLAHPLLCQLLQCSLQLCCQERRGFRGRIRQLGNSGLSGTDSRVPVGCKDSRVGRIVPVADGFGWLAQLRKGGLLGDLLIYRRQHDR